MVATSCNLNAPRCTTTVLQVRLHGPRGGCLHWSPTPPGPGDPCKLPKNRSFTFFSDVSHTHTHTRAASPPTAAELFQKMHSGNPRSISNGINMVFMVSTLPPYQARKKGGPYELKSRILKDLKAERELPCCGCSVVWPKQVSMRRCSVLIQLVLEHRQATVTSLPGRYNHRQGVARQDVFFFERLSFVPAKLWRQTADAFESRVH